MGRWVVSLVWVIRESAQRSYVELLSRVVSGTLVIAGTGMAVPVISLILVDIVLSGGLQSTAQ
jgi:hypothetical protein